MLRGPSRRRVARVNEQFIICADVRVHSRSAPRSTDVPVAKLRLMLKGEQLEDERSVQDYHIRRDEVLTLILKEPDGNAAQTAQVDCPHVRVTFRLCVRQPH